MAKSGAQTDVQKPDGPTNKNKQTKKLHVIGGEIRAPPNLAW